MPTSPSMLSTAGQLTTMTTSMSCTTSTASKQSTDTFRQRVAFDMHYGTKSSTRPKFTVDSSRKEVEQEEEIPNQSKKSSKSKKRKSEILDLMETNHNDLNEPMKRFHNENMQRYDRLLDLYEREFDIKQNKTS